MLMVLNLFRLFSFKIINQVLIIYLALFQRDQMIHGWITCAHSESVLPQAVGAASARLAWEKLRFGSCVRHYSKLMAKMKLFPHTCNVSKVHLINLRLLIAPISEDLMVESMFTINMKIYYYHVYNISITKYSNIQNSYPKHYYENILRSKCNSSCSLS